MSRPTNPFFFHVLLGIVFLVAVQLLLPGETALWRRVIAGFLSVGLGYQLATALLFPADSKAARIKPWLEALAFPMLIAGFVLIPEISGWILIASGMLWRFLVARVLRQP